MSRKVRLLNTQQYLAVRNEAFLNDNITPSADPNNFYGYAPDLKIWDTTRYTDWQKELIGGNAKYSDLHATISGGSANTQYLLGVGYHHETTVIPGSMSDNKGSINFNVNDVSQNQKLRIQFGGSYTADHNNLVARDLTQDAIRMAPVAPALFNRDGSLNWATTVNGKSTWVNPLAYLANKYDQNFTNLIGKRYRKLQDFKQF